MKKSTLEKLEESCELLEQIDFFSPEKKSFKELQDFFLIVTTRIEEEKQLVEELDLQCNKNFEKEISLKEKVKENTNNMSIDQQIIEEYKNVVLENTQLCDKMKEEIEALDKQISNETHHNHSDEYVTSETLKLTVFRELGISMQVEDDFLVKKAILTTPDRHDIRTIPLETRSTKQIAKIIWDFISRNLI